MLQAMNNTANEGKKVLNAEKASNAEVKGARWLYEANVAREAGRLSLAEKLYTKAQYWHDKMNKFLGNA